MYSHPATVHPVYGDVWASLKHGTSSGRERSLKCENSVKTTSFYEFVLRIAIVCARLSGDKDPARLLAEAVVVATAISDGLILLVLSFEVASGKVHRDETSLDNRHIRRCTQLN